MFLDTSFLLALALTDDEHHSRAVTWQQAVTGKLLTTEYVLVELIDALADYRVRPPGPSTSYPFVPSGPVLRQKERPFFC